MNSLLPVVSILTIAAITPGPNNIIVMSAAMRGGFLAALPPIASIITGGLLLMVMIWAGGDVIFNVIPDFKSMLRIAGACYLLWLGINIVWEALRSNLEEGSKQSNALPSSLFGVAFFQFLNPKSWVLIGTVTMAMKETTSGLIVMALLMGVVMACCLSLWALAGSTLANWLRHRPTRRMVDVAMGLLLIGSTAMLFL